MANWAAGLHALGQGLNLLSERQGRREELNWRATRQESLSRFDHGLRMEEEAKRAENVRQENAAQRTYSAEESAKQRTFAEGESRKNREADMERAKMAEAGANRRMDRQEVSDSKRELSELRRHRASTLQTFRSQYGKALEDYNQAKAAGAADDRELGEMLANIDYIRHEMMDFDVQSKDALAAAGDVWAKAQMRGDEDFPGAAGSPPGAGSLVTAPTQGAAQPKGKPMSAKPAIVKPAAVPALTLPQIEAEMAELKPLADKWGVDVDTPENYRAWSRWTTLEEQAKELRKVQQRAAMKARIATERANDRMLPSSF